MMLRLSPSYPCGTAAYRRHQCHTPSTYFRLLWKCVAEFPRIKYYSKPHVIDEEFELLRAVRPRSFGKSKMPRIYPLHSLPYIFLGLVPILFGKSDFRNFLSSKGHLCPHYRMCGIPPQQLSDPGCGSPEKQPCSPI